MTATSLSRLRLRMAALALAVSAGGAQAVENGAIITPPGVFDFGSGILPPASEYGSVATRFAFTRASRLRDGDGNESPVKPKLSVDALVLAGLKMTDVDFLGGKYGFGVVVPMLRGSLDLSIPTPAGRMTLSGDNTAVGDVQIAPVIVRWTPSRQFFANAGLVLQLPTGSYDEHRTINAGVNHWTVQPNLGMTYITSSGLEFSTNIQVNFNLRNKATDYRSGIEWQQDFAVGQHVGHWIFGAGGYRYVQLTDDKAPGLTDGHRSKVWALGPAIGFVAPKSGLPVMFLHAYKEFGARNRAEGTQVALRMSWTF